MRRQDMRYGPIKIFAGNAGKSLAEKICQRLSISLSQANVSRFKDGEVRVDILENVRDCDVFIINPTNPPAENLMEMIILADAIRGSSARRITLVPTILGYNRQDRKDKPRAPLSARLVCQMLSLVKPSRALLIDLHSEPTMGFFDNSIIV
ncbi:MAG: ribose-phosphate diphosphokinase, partial [Patescibacteria group bacterium]